MDTRKLRVLLDTIKIKSINKAAEELGYTQSGLTYLLNSLEEELGVPLLVRNRRGVFLSEEGEQLYPHIAQILSAEDEMFHALRIIKEKKSDQLIIGSYPSISLFLLPETIKLFQNKYPDTDVDLRVGSQTLNFQLENNEIDLALVSREQNTDFEWEPLFRDPMYAAIPTTNPLAYKNCLTLESWPMNGSFSPAGNQKNIVLTGLQTSGWTRNVPSRCPPPTHGSAVYVSKVLRHLPFLHVPEELPFQCADDPSGSAALPGKSA